MTISYTSSYLNGCHRGVIASMKYLIHTDKYAVNTEINNNLAYNYKQLDVKIVQKHKINIKYFVQYQLLNKMF